MRHSYAELVPALNRICGDLRQWMVDACNRHGIVDPRIEGRVKEPHSLLLKALDKAWDDPLRQASDKVGVRVDVVYNSDVDVLCDYVAERNDIFGIAQIDDKRANDDITMGYQGVNIDVIPHERYGVAEQQATCEIQIRTAAQSAWAMAQHDLVYKPVVDLPTGMKRRVYRLSALLECFDDAVADARTEIMGTAGYPVAIVVRELRRARLRYTAQPHSPELSHRIVEPLLGQATAEQAHNLTLQLRTFIEKHDDKLRTAMARHVEGQSALLVTQPEAILIFYLLDADRFGAISKWDDVGIPRKYFNQLADIWGVRVE